MNLRKRELIILVCVAGREGGKEGGRERGREGERVRWGDEGRDR